MTMALPDPVQEAQAQRDAQARARARDAYEAAQRSGKSNDEALKAAREARGN
jgi:hypothetical protein